jgi:DNA polymerase-3 subunit delta'
MLPPLLGHAALRRRLAARRDALPQSVLLHGPRGAGKQRLALWLAQALVCDAPTPDGPCESCAACAAVRAGSHPDVLWFFPIERVDSDDPDDALVAMAEAAQARVAAGAWGTPDGTCGIHIALVQGLVRRAALTPARASRKVIVVGDAERMTQGGSEFAANAFLKLLEEPPTDTWLLLTSAEPGALLPTIRSRVTAVRVPAPGPADLAQVRALPGVAAALDGDVTATPDAERLLAAATAGREARLRAAFGLGVAGARGHFTDTLDALGARLAERVRAAATTGDAAAATGAARGLDAVEHAKERAAGNVNPQLVGWELLETLARTLR